jgi:hypothetical protein
MNDGLTIWRPADNSVLVLLLPDAMGFHVQLQVQLRRRGLVFDHAASSYAFS